MTTTQKSLFSVIRYALTCAGLCVGALFVASPFSCKLSEEGIEIISVDKTAPQILSFDFKQRTVLEIVCTEAITLKNVMFKKADAEDAALALDVSYDESKTIAEINLAAPTEIGVRYHLTGVAEDLNGNSLTFSLPFTGYNDNLARLILSEVRSEGTAKTPEFVELYVLKSGNLAGLQLLDGYDGTEKAYTFPSIDVQKGEYITVHFRHDSDTPDFCTDELGTDLTLATVAPNNNNCDTARDLWATNEDNGSRITKNDVILLTADSGNRVIDAVLFAESGKSDWTKAFQRELAAKAVAKGIWASALISDAACSDNATSTRTLCRQNVATLAEQTFADDVVIPVSPDDWFIVNNACATPGLPNASERYIK